ncbi:PRP3-domain-containing protein [Basidiobolus meristosporus CBS 931.73]|uniref:PRP3-domain-containing protein n=1 Tax=Basidiobolus meristosporus CBS 931.73 TaxID=1314790 RepID=A0A1Y1VT85_9FUNG|nr:PRP3-domain-containing protein [Basidiobolus meristosporus CBS 931.73]|eukprot:ORX64511.1 PRP3-domain-containing protein [Basidiobolus meristosporus CBS 931.73]
MIAKKQKEVAEKFKNFSNGHTSNASPTPPPTSSSTPFSAAELQRRIQETKERVAAQTRNPYLPSTSKGGDVQVKPKGGLHVPSHPILMVDQLGNFKKGSKLIPKANFATVKANQRVASQTSKRELKLLSAPTEFSDVTKNPYFDPSLGTDYAAPKSRAPKRLRFNEKGKFIAQAENIRAQIQLEKLKEQIAAGVKKAGMEELDLMSDKAIKRDPPPTIEWWDAQLLTNGTYEDLDSGEARVEGESSVITQYIQHPVPIEPPVDLNAPKPKPLMLTKKERKKLRRQRRLELQKEKQDKIRLGLLPPEEPKVKMSNFMRVLGEQAVMDPSKIEAQVRAQVDKRQQAHLRQNAERKLTDEQRREKKAKKLNEDTSQTSQVAVFKIKDLSHPQKKFKVEMNAQQLYLTGTAVFNPDFNLVIVEGGPKGIKAYKKLMLRRIKWSDASDDEDEVPEKANNYCLLVWEGEIKERGFKGFRFRRCESENHAREWLSKGKAEHYWDLAKNVNSDELLQFQTPM